MAPPTRMPTRTRASIGPAGIEMLFAKRAFQLKIMLQSDQQELKFVGGAAGDIVESASIGPAGIEILHREAGGRRPERLQSDQQELKYHMRHVHFADVKASIGPAGIEIIFQYGAGRFLHSFNRTSRN